MATAQALPVAGLQSYPWAGKGGFGIGAIKAKYKFPQPCVVLALGRMRGLVARRGRREGQTSQFNMPGACQACLGPCAVRKWTVSSGPALVPAHQSLRVPKAHGHQGSAFYPAVILLQANYPKKCLPHPKTSNTGAPSAPCWGKTSHFDHKPLLRKH